jgi:hypothetical protein
MAHWVETSGKCRGCQHGFRKTFVVGSFTSLCKGSGVVGVTSSALHQRYIVSVGGGLSVADVEVIVSDIEEVSIVSDIREGYVFGRGLRRGLRRGGTAQV